jgi:hypothetical protein
MTARPGIPSALNWRFTAALCLHALACLFFAETGASGPFVWSQLFFSGVIAFVVATTICWQWRLFGDPTRLANLVPHVAFFLSGMFFVNRLFAKTDYSLLDQVVAAARGLARSVVSWFPQVVFDILHSPGIAVLFLGVCLALVFRRVWALGFLLLVLLVAVLLAMSGDDFRNPVAFLLGLACMVGALGLQNSDPLARSFWSRVHDRLKGDAVLRADAELKVRLLKRLWELERPLGEMECVGVVSRALGMKADTPEARQITGHVVMQMVLQDQLAIVLQDQAGVRLALRPDLASSSRIDWLAAAASIPKALLMALIALVWVVSPIDLIPDATPVLGSLDDATVAVLSTLNLIQALRGTGDGEPGIGVFPHLPWRP